MISVLTGLRLTGHVQKLTVAVVVDMFSRFAVNQLHSSWKSTFPFTCSTVSNVEPSLICITTTIVTVDEEISAT